MEDGWEYRDGYGDNWKQDQSLRIEPLAGELLCQMI